MADSTRRRIETGTAAEKAAGFSQAVRVGDMVFVWGMNASDDSGAGEHPGDAAGQTRCTLAKIEAVLGLAGASLKDVVRTRIFLRNEGDAAAVANIHREIFGEVRPATSFVTASPIGEARLVEIEADAIVS